MGHNQGFCELVGTRTLFPMRSAVIGTDESSRVGLRAVIKFDVLGLH